MHKNIFIFFLFFFVFFAAAKKQDRSDILELASERFSDALLSYVIKSAPYITFAQFSDSIDELVLELDAYSNLPVILKHFQNYMNLYRGNIEKQPHLIPYAFARQCLAVFDDQELRDEAPSTYQFLYQVINHSELVSERKLCELLQTNQEFLVKALRITSRVISVDQSNSAEATPTYTFFDKLDSGMWYDNGVHIVDTATTVLSCASTSGSPKSGLEITNAEAGNPVSITVASVTETDVALTVSSKGTGALNLQSGATGALTLTSSNTGTDAIDIQATSGGITIDTLSCSLTATTMTLVPGTGHLTVATDGATHAVVFNGLATESGTSLDINASNEVTVNASSRRFKENIVSTNQQDTDWIYKLQARKFNFIDDKNKKTNYGWIAEEVAEFDQLVVNYDQDGNPFSLKYTSFIPLVVEEMKKLKTTIDQLQTQVETLQQKSKFSIDFSRQATTRVPTVPGVLIYGADAFSINHPTLPNTILRHSYVSAP